MGQVLSQPRLSMRSRFSNAGQGVDLRPRLGNIEQPTLVIHGRLDVAVPLENAEKLAASILTSELKIVEDADDAPSVRRPTEVVDAIAAFLAVHQDQTSSPAAGKAVL